MKKIRKNIFILLCLLSLFTMVNGVEFNNIYPANGSRIVPLDVTVYGTVLGNTSLDNVNVTFINGSNTVLCALTNYSNNTIASCKLPTLIRNQIFFWRVNITDGGDTLITNIYNFTSTGVAYSTGLNIDIDANVSSLSGMGDFLGSLIDVGLDTLIHVLQRYPEIAVLILIVGVILLILAMIKGVFGSIGGFFKSIKLK